MAAPAGGKQKHAVGISRNPPEPHMLRWAVSAGNTEYKHMVVSAGRTQTRNQIDGMDRWTAGWICRRIDGNGSVDLWTDGWETMFVLSYLPNMLDNVYPRCDSLMDAGPQHPRRKTPPLPYARLLKPFHPMMTHHERSLQPKPKPPLVRSQRARSGGR